MSELQLSYAEILREHFRMLKIISNLRKALADIIAEGPEPHIARIAREALTKEKP